MTTGDRIKQRRTELNMSQDELAHLVGYSSRSTINKIELGINQLRQKKIAAFAEALQVSPLWLIGIEKADDGGNDSASLIGKSFRDPKCLKLIHNYWDMDTARQDQLLQFSEALILLDASEAD